MSHGKNILKDTFCEEHSGFVFVFNIMNEGEPCQ